METEASFSINPTWSRLFLVGRKNLGNSTLSVILYSLLYYLLGLASLRYNIDASGVPVIWLPSGLALVIVLLGGYRFVMSVLLGMALLTLQQGLALPMAVGVVAGVILGAILPVLLWRMLGFNPRLERIRDVMLFVGIGAILSPLLVASTGVLGLSDIQLDWGLLPKICLAWWLANSIGSMVVAGFLLVWMTADQDRVSSKRWLSILSLLCGGAAATWLSLSDSAIGGPGLALFALIPLSVFAAIFCGRQGVTLLAMGVLAIMMVSLNSVPLNPSDVLLVGNMTFSLALLWVASFTGLVVAAAYSEQGAGDRYAYLAQHDGLTRLINRSTFEQRLEQAIQHAKREGRPQVHALMFLDLDDFKLINDQFGHATGDLVLRRLSDLLLSQVRSRDTVARLGGDEFVVLLENCSADCSRQMAERIAASIRGMLIPVEKGHCQVTVSIGVTPVGYNTGTLESVLSAADAAHYRAKDEGKNQVHYRYAERVTDEC